MFWKNRKNKYKEIKNIYKSYDGWINISNTELISDQGVEKCDIREEDSVISMSNMPERNWMVMLNPFDISSGNKVFYIDLDITGSKVFSFFIKDENGNEFWSENIKISEKNNRFYFDIKELKSPSWSEKKEKGIKITHFGLYFRKVNNKTEIFVKDIQIYSKIKKECSRLFQSDIFNNIKKGSYVLEDNNISLTRENDSFIFKEIEESTLRIRFDFSRFINTQNISGVGMFIQTSNSVRLEFIDIDENHYKGVFQKSLNNTCDLSVFFSDIPEYRNTPVKSIILEFIPRKKNISFSLIDFSVYVEKDKLKTFYDSEKNDNFLFTGRSDLFSEKNGFWNFEYSNILDHIENVSERFSVKAQADKEFEESYIISKFNFFENKKIKKSDFEGLCLFYDSEGNFDFQFILNFKGSGQLWSLPVKTYRDENRMLMLRFKDLYIPEWVENKKIVSEEVESISILFRTKNKIDFNVGASFLFYSENSDKDEMLHLIESGKEKSVYPVDDINWELFSENNIDFTLSKEDVLNYSIENNLNVEFEPGIDQNAFIMADINLPNLMNIDSSKINGIGIFYRFSSENSLNLIIKDENENELWSNPLKGKTNACFEYIPLSSFFAPEWINNSRDLSNLIKNISFNFSGTERDRFTLYNIQLYTDDYSVYMNKYSRELSPVYNFRNIKHNDMFLNIISPENVVVNKKNIRENSIDFKVLSGKDSYIILRYNLESTLFTDFSVSEYISLILNINKKCSVRIVLTDFENRQLSINHLDISEKNCAVHKFSISDFINGDTSTFNISEIRNLEIHLNGLENNIDDGTLIFSDPVIFGNKNRIDDKKYILEDFNFYGEKELRDYWVSSGNDSKVEIIPSHKDNNLEYPCLKVDFSILSEDSENNWIIMKRNDLDNITDYSVFDYITFYFKSECKGTNLRIRLYDKNNNSGECVYKALSDITGWVKVNVPVKKLAENIDLTSIKSYEFYIGLDYAKPPVRGSFYFATYTEKIEINEKNTSAKAVITSNIEIENLEKKINISKPKIMVSDSLLNKDDVENLIQRNINKNIMKFSRSDLKLEESKKLKKWSLSGVAVFVEPTNLCNLSCIMCNHGDNSFDRSLGVMKFKDFKRVCDEIGEKKFNIWEVSPFWLGESFIHPQICEFIDYISDIRRIPGTIQHFNVHTNGNVLTDDHIESIVNSELDSILFSIDAATDDTYRKIRVNGELSVVLDNIRKLLERRKEKGRKRPAVILQFIVMDENVHEIMGFVELGKSLGIEEVIYAGRKEDNIHNLPMKDNLLFPQIDYDLVFIKSLEPNALTKEQTHREIITKMPENIKRRPCGSLWRMCSIAWDGTATACCRDDQVKMPIGNVIEEGLENVWYGQALKDIRLAHVLGDFHKVSKCEDCVNWVKYPVKDEEVFEWLESIGEEKLIDIYKKRFNKEGKSC